MTESFARLLCTLRWLAVAGQLVAILVVTGPLGIPLPIAPLVGGVALLAAFNLWVTALLRRRGEPSPASVAAHLLVDVAVLAWQVAWSGGIDNPFSSLFLLPMALAVLALPPRRAFLVASACAVGYGASVLFAREIPHLHHLAEGFALHKFGMFVNFLVSALVLVSFFARMVAASREKDREMARLREQFTRREGIVALATHAASVAHELNTPLATMTLMVDELEQAGGTPQQLEDFATLRSLLEVCRERVMELAAPSARVDLEDVISRWQLVRPTIELRRTGNVRDLDRVEPAVGYLLQVLLNNAADAGERAGRRQVDLRLDVADGCLQGEIRDYGSGIDEAKPVLPATLFRSDKPHGMGIGLALSHATVERLGGELSMNAPEEGEGVRVAFRLPACVPA